MAKKTYCSGCNVTHTSLMCFNKPRAPLRAESKKARNKRQTTNWGWFEKNPPNEKGQWLCYLQVSDLCPKVLTRTTITLEHVKSRARSPELKYDVNNLKPACRHCNKLKGSLTVGEVLRRYGKM